MFHPFILRFESEKTPVDVYQIAVVSLQSAVDVAMILAEPRELREIELTLAEMLAKVRNVQSREGVR